MPHLEKQYEDICSQILKPIASQLEEYIRDCVSDYERIDKISVRVKSTDRFIKKANKLNDNGERKYSDPITEIQDQIGARIVTYYLHDVDELSAKIEGYFARIERKHLIPESLNEFGYEGKHYVMFIPDDVLPPSIDRDKCPKFFELQIKTLFQHAWGEAGHDLIYKPDSNLTNEQKRKAAFTAAQAWGADVIFNELWKATH